MDTDGKLYRHGYVSIFSRSMALDAGSKVLRLERWQALFLTAVEFDEGKSTRLACEPQAQVGKTLLALGVGLRCRCRWARGPAGILYGSGSARDLSRRLEAAIERSPSLRFAKMFPSARSGPGSHVRHGRIVVSLPVAG